MGQPYDCFSRNSIKGCMSNAYSLMLILEYCGTGTPQYRSTIIYYL